LAAAQTLVVETEAEFPFLMRTFLAASMILFFVALGSFVLFLIIQFSFILFLCKIYEINKII